MGTDLKQWIGYYENVIDSTTCKEIMESNWEWKARSSQPPEANKTAFVGGNASKTRADFDEDWLDEHHEYHHIYQALKESRSKVIDLYKKEHERFNFTHHSDFRISRYDTGGYVIEHCDLRYAAYKDENDSPEHSSWTRRAAAEKWGYPQAGIFMFPNDDYEGGELIVADNVINYTAGSAIMFPSTFMFNHEVKPVTKGQRWSIISWYL